MKLARLALAGALCCAPFTAHAQTVYGTADLNRNTCVVDVVGNGPSGQSATKAACAVSIDGPSGRATQGASGQAAVALRQTSTTSAVALPSNALSNGVIVKALSTNSGTAYIGPAGVTTSNGYPLAAGEAISYGVANTNQLYLIGSDATQIIAVTGN